MQSDKRTAIIWGPLRFALGVTQMLFVPLSVYVLITQGAESQATWAIVLFTTLVTAISRILYRGNKYPPGSDK